MKDSLPCDVILISWNNLEFIRACIGSIIENTDPPYRLIVVDNGSQKETIDYLEGFKDDSAVKIELLKNSENLGWTKAINQGIKKSTAPYLCFLNNDCIVMKGWLTQMLRVATSYPLIGLINPTFNINRQTLEDFRLKSAHPDNRRIQYIELNECNGACMLVKRELIEKIGGLDESFGMGGMDDSDFSRRAAKTGYRCVCARASYVFHWGNVSTNIITDYWQKIRQKNRQIFIERWGSKKQVGCIIDGVDSNNEAELIGRLKECLSIARQGVRFHIWVRLDSISALTDAFYRFSKGIPEHNNIKYSFKRMPRGLFILFCLVKFISRMIKKDEDRLKALFCKDEITYRYLNTFRWVCGARIFKELREWKDFPS